MKTKKIIPSILLTFTLFACSLSQAQPVAAAMTKKQAVAIIKENNKKQDSGKMHSTTTTLLKNDKTAITIDGYYNNTSKLVNETGAIKYGNKKDKVNVWVDGKNNRLYNFNKNKWEYETVPDAYQTLINDLTGQKSLVNLSNSIFKNLEKNGKLTHKKGVYQLTGSVNGQKYVKPVMQVILKSDIKNKDIKSFTKNVKIGKIKLNFTLTNQKVVSAQGKTTAKLKKGPTIKISETFSHFNEYGNLALPDDVKNAVPVKTDK
ncbi:hypothetical protein GYM69_09780 [Lactobacillus panisapium]|uniref:hypothetical protein n=1 Tax=Lactobacillus panisapium TaxID=2012495 RepID=UPI001C69D3F2|nr:hypothetical protein [Lactobacillus panisapium]QYN57389.1 hypothetical protein GYM69_09780 [Lactobacillus panisapium]